MIISWKFKVFTIMIGLPQALGPPTETVKTKNLLYYNINRFLAKIHTWK